MTNDTPEIAAIRARFEEWHADKFPHAPLNRDGDEYEFFSTKDLWQAFLAGAKTEPVPKGILQASYRASRREYTECQVAVDQQYKDTQTIAKWAIENMPQLKGTNDE